MKKLISIILLTAITLTCFMPLGVNAAIGDVIGQALYTDIITYIDSCPIYTYVVNDRIVVVAEDLRDYGFDVIWDGNARTLTISDSTPPLITPDVYETGIESGTVFQNVLETDIKVYAEGILITSYNINGKTMIPLEELTMFGDFEWFSVDRLLFMVSVATENINGINCYKGSTIATYTDITGLKIWETVSQIIDGTEVNLYIYPILPNENGKPSDEIYVDYLSSLGWKSAIMEDYTNDEVTTHVFVNEDATQAMVIAWSTTSEAIMISPPVNK